MKTIDKIQKLYYDTFHDGKPPLEFGCEVKTNENSEIITLLTKTEDNGYNYLCCNNIELDYAVYSWEETKLKEIFIDYDCEKYEIIGKPISITMLLRLLEITQKDDYAMCLLLDGDLAILQYVGDGERKELYPIEFDLSQGDLLRDQSEETIIKIAKLLMIE